MIVVLSQSPFLIIQASMLHLFNMDAHQVLSTSWDEDIGCQMVMSAVQSFSRVGVQANG